MSDQGEIHVEDETVFRAQITDQGVAVDLSSAVNAGDKRIFIRRPSGSTIDAEWEFVPAPDAAGDGSDGWVQYVASISPTVDLSEAGDYQVQGTFRTPRQNHTNIDEFRVHANLS